MLTSVTPLENDWKVRDADLFPNGHRSASITPGGICSAEVDVAGSDMSNSAGSIQAQNDGVAAANVGLRQTTGDRADVVVCELLRLLLPTSTISLQKFRVNVLEPATVCLIPLTQCHPQQ
jgi:hypothetical protein